MLVPNVEGFYLLIFRERRFPMHVAIARQHEDCIYILQPKSLGEPAIYRNRIGHCAVVLDTKLCNRRRYTYIGRSDKPPRRRSVRWRTVMTATQHSGSSRSTGR